MDTKQKAYLQLHAAIFFWGFTGVLGTAISVTAPALVYYRMFFTALFIAFFMTIHKKWQKIPWIDMKKLIFIGFLFAIHWLAFYWSIKLAGGSIAMVCLATASVFTALFNPWINKGKIQISEIIIGIIALLGVLIMYLMMDDSKSNIKSAEDMRLGIILGVFTAIISALFTVLNKPLAQQYEFRNIVFYEMLSGFVFLSILLPFYVSQTPIEQLIPNTWDYLWLFCLVYFCTVLGQQLVIQSLQVLNPFTVTLSVNLEPIYGVVLAFLIHKENQFLGMGFYIGVAIIFFSLVLQILHTKQKTKKEKQNLPIPLD